jgi:RimJ/RimL family protein N-acetyltransferase
MGQVRGASFSAGKPTVSRLAVGKQSVSVFVYEALLGGSHDRGVCTDARMGLMSGRPPKKQQRIRLEPLTPEDFPLIRPWIDPRVFRIFHEPIDDAQLNRLLSKHEDGRPTSLGFRIVRLSDSEIIGLIHAVIDWKNNLAHIGQIIVGDRTNRRAGVGTASLTRLLRICFNELGLHRVQLFVDEDNSSAIGCYKKVGFKAEGLMRDAARTDDGYVSWYSMSILEDEWRD